jgi:hypothetical protein
MILEFILVSIALVYLNLPNKTDIGHVYKPVTSNPMATKYVSNINLNTITKECFDNPNRFFPECRLTNMSYEFLVSPILT